VTERRGPVTVPLMHAPLLFLAWVSLGLIACAPASFDTELKGETTVPAGPPGNSTVLNAFPAIASFAGLDFNQSQDFKNQGITKEEVSSVQAKSVELRLLGPADADFGFLDTLEFFAKAGDRRRASPASRTSPGWACRHPTPCWRWTWRTRSCSPSSPRPP